MSIGTASDALRGKGRISDTTRQRIMAAAEELGYRANANARILALGRTHIVALVLQQDDSGPGPRIYWPRVHAAFTNRLFGEGFVACTMTVDDLHQLDGLPFDLIVLADLTDASAIPDEIRAAYHILEVSVFGPSPAATAMRDQVNRMCRGVLAELTQEGAVNPALVVAKQPMVPVDLIVSCYEQWCRESNVNAVVVTQDPDESDVHFPHQVDAIFSTVVGSVGLGPADPELQASTIRLDTDPARQPTGRARQLTIDGTSIGSQLADNVIAYLKQEPTRPLELAWQLDGRPWQPRPLPRQ
ncbi:MAG: LacI family DNA-binding transcriptional regulator [Actinomycetia bacterium]|nr:LacI family DNA-binding transcriptional regulator [Actinomycetes bacterium]